MRITDPRLAKACKECGEPILHRLPSAKYCTGTCRDRHTNRIWNPKQIQRRRRERGMKAL